jgi:hypothetical protein
VNILAAVDVPIEVLLRRVAVPVVLSVCAENNDVIVVEASETTPPDWVRPALRVVAPVTASVPVAVTGALIVIAPDEAILNMVDELAWKFTKSAFKVFAALMPSHVPDTLPPVSKLGPKSARDVVA